VLGGFVVNEIIVERTAQDLHVSSSCFTTKQLFFHRILQNYQPLLLSEQAILVHEISILKLFLATNVERSCF